MRIKSLISFSLLSLIAGTLFMGSAQAEVYPHYPKINYGKGAHAKLVKRGQFLVRMGDCIACHTGLNGKQPFAGGRPMFTPFGTFFSPNITPDKKTGIGSWSEAQFIKVMHDGVRPNGSNSYPVFPYLWFTKVKTTDLQAIWAYLKALKPIDKQNKLPYVEPPFRWRWVQTFWKVMYFDWHKGVYKYDPYHSKLWNRGAYLVEGLGHCGMCHTPINFIGIPKSNYMLTGSSVSGMLAPNITSTGVVKNHSIQQVVDVFHDGKLLGGGKLGGGMEEAYKDSLKYIDHRDLVAIATFLKGFKSKDQPEKQTLSGSPKAIGAGLYQDKCSACHAQGSGGAPKFGDINAWAPRIKQGMKTLYKNAINGYKGMPAKGLCTSCSDQEVKDAVLYMVKAAESEKPTKPAGKAYAELTMAYGKKMYATHCSACHEKGVENAPVVGNKKQWAPIIKHGMPLLFERSLRGYGEMPAKGGCDKCNDAQLKAAVVYMVQASASKGNYSLWLQD